MTKTNAIFSSVYCFPTLIMRPMPHVTTSPPTKTTTIIRAAILLTLEASTAII